jgi:hypothetical protein
MHTHNIPVDIYTNLYFFVYIYISIYIYIHTSYTLLCIFEWQTISIYVCIYIRVSIASVTLEVLSLKIYLSLDYQVPHCVEAEASACGCKHIYICNYESGSKPGLHRHIYIYILYSLLALYDNCECIYIYISDIADETKYVCIYIYIHACNL